MNDPDNYLKSICAELRKYKLYAEKTFAQLDEKDIHWQFTENDNSIAIIVKHIVGNMLSRFTNFMTEDGEKSWRHRDTEFENAFANKKEMLIGWEEGWNCLLNTLETISHENFDAIVTIRNEKHTVVQAINRQFGHYVGHIGQIIYLGKMIKGSDWKSLSIPKGQSESFNTTKFKNG